MKNPRKRRKRIFALPRVLNIKFIDGRFCVSVEGIFVEEAGFWSFSISVSAF